jgi:tRNA (guanine-N7-)-methyltransferase
LGSKNKLKRFKENISFKNVIQPTREELIDNGFEYKGKWGELFFNNNNPIVIELGCGKGEYSVELAKLYPEINFIGIDIKGARFWRGAKIATDNEIANVAFVRSQIELVDKIFSRNEISEIWITFPDPQIKFKREKHRLINLNFIELYSKILAPNGIINLKTDSEFLHGYMLGLIKSTDFLELIYSNHNIYNNTGAPKNAVSIQTFYESKFLKQGKPITFVNFRVTK